ncbi:PREDICTED: acylphosphatase-2 [Drosophila arizonae]|uniref:acylphosphatase n=1 Tax=Drosophila arizonae TaxID=7263 RepID=A0ABM1NMP0_DROAR|nr:PREDICTED: acylphosphatase-2 [Drosophila arizonae]
MVFSYKSDLVLKVNIVIIIVLFVTSQVSGNQNSSIAMTQLFACSFEVFGQVQGVFFRKYTEKQANELGVRGWCMNTPNGTVRGELEAPLAPLNEMKDWLQNKGSPNSKIENAVFSPTKKIENYSFNKFTVIR